MAEEDVSAALAENPKEAQPIVKIFDESTIVSEVRVEVDKASALLNLSTSAACKVMNEFDWNYDKLQDNYFEDAGILERLGLHLGDRVYYRVDLSKGNVTCPLCFMTYPEDGPEEVYALLGCGHAVCSSCWEQFLTDAVKRKGPYCTNLTCPIGVSTGNLTSKNCNVLIDEPMFKRFLPASLYPRYEYYVVRSFVESNPRIKWCATRGCGRALRCEDYAHATAVECLCGFKTCFKCGNEAHAPATCAMMEQWHVREMGESDNLAYIKTHTKPCPTCNTPVERHEGCMHMVCTACGAAGRKKDWCWVCGQLWDFKGRHGNLWYNPPCKDDPQVQEKTFANTQVQTELYRYIKYYSGYAEHEKTRRFQITKDKEKAEGYMRCIVKHNPGLDASYVMMAVNALIVARTYLKFAYVYGYHLPESHQPFFDWKVKGVEEEVSKLSNMMEDLYRHDINSVEDPPWRDDQVVDQASLLKQKLEDVMLGFSAEDDC
eukprot:GGOE01020812.1.p1 GENE.GGOE01020812.1~~GGOE01020812.1.p1  ORF type:complete len:509 (-),score=180.97 GGOE01020812.1:236-1699(-)